MRWLPSGLSDLGRRGSDDLVSAMLTQLECAHLGAEVAREAVLGLRAPREARSRLSEIEHDGDAARADLVLRLSSALVTPLDREDLFRASRAIDDVLDDLRDFVRSVDLLPVDTWHPLGAMLRSIAQALGELEASVRAISDAPTTTAQLALATSKAVNLVRQIYQDTLAELLAEEPVTVELLRRRELLGAVDLIGTRVREAASIVADGAIKRA